MGRYAYLDNISCPKHIVTFGDPVPVYVRTNEQTYRETYRENSYAGDMAYRLDDMLPVYVRTNEQTYRKHIVFHDISCFTI